MKPKYFSSLSFKFAIAIFACLTTSSIFSLAIFYIFNLFGVSIEAEGWGNFLVSIGFSLIIGALFSVVVVKFIRRKTKPFTKALEDVANGKFDVELKVSQKDVIFAPVFENVNKMIKELNSVEILRNDFISNFSHEFKTPIASINGFAELLQEGNLTKKERNEYLKVIVDETARLANLSNNILLMSKLDSQELVTAKQSFKLDEQIRQCIILFEKELKQKNINVEVNLQKVTYVGNAELIKQIWVNLINNAIKFSNNNGNLTINLTQVQQSVLITITDDGCGMDEKTLSHMFVKFYQGENKNKKQGHGLGLSIVKRIIQLCEGEIGATSEKNKGTTFTVTLPVTNK